MISQDVINLFKAAASDVPAYRDFLKREAFDPMSVNSVEDFQRVPLISKKNYLQQYSLSELLWGGILGKPLIFCST